MRIVTLLSDFGLEDSYVGEMKGALLRIAPGIVPVDLSHAIGAGEVREGAWVLRACWNRFPVGTVHLAVVDPGVGGDRRGLVAAAGGHWFVGPDNGLIMPAVESAGGGEIREITTRELDWERRGTTFDGRDVFAPAAARLVNGAQPSEFGPEVHDPRSLAPFAPAQVADGWDVEIARVDRFGNLVTVVDETFLRRELGSEWRSARVRAGDECVDGVRLSYADADESELLLSIGGAGTLEISVNRGSAAERLSLRPGDRVLLMGPES